MDSHTFSNGEPIVQRVASSNVLLPLSEQSEALHAWVGIREIKTNVWTPAGLQDLFWNPFFKPILVVHLWILYPWANETVNFSYQKWLKKSFHYKIVFKRVIITKKSG